MKRGMNDAAVGSGRLVRESASPSLKLLYLGESSGTSRHRFEALRRLGHEVRLVEPRTAFFHNAWLGAWAFKTGSFGLEALIHNYVRREIGDDRFDVVWIDNGEFVGNALAKRLKAHAPVVLCHNLDNPFVARDGWRWRLLRDALPVYDLFVTPRVSSAQSAARAGARRTLRAVQSADEVAHLVTDSRKTASLDVVFVGSWMPERGPFLARLLERGVPLQIYGPNWHKAPEFANLSPVKHAVTTATRLMPKFSRAPKSRSVFSRKAIRICTRRGAWRFRPWAPCFARPARRTTCNCTAMASKPASSTMPRTARRSVSNCLAMTSAAM